MAVAALRLGLPRPYFFGKRADKGWIDGNVSRGTRLG
jgi:hypothetical protein